MTPLYVEPPAPAPSGNWREWQPCTGQFDPVTTDAILLRLTTRMKVRQIGEESAQR